MKRYLLLLVIPLVLTGCIQVSFGGSSSSAVAGVWRSDDQGENFNSVINILTSDGSKQTIAGVSVSSLTFDPADAKTIYLGTDKHGLFTSNNRGQGWTQILSGRLGPIRSVAVDAKYRCTIYAAANNRIYKTIDCGKTWSQAYVDSRPQVIVKTVKVAPEASHLVLIGLSTGDLQLSRDYGQNWTTVKRFGDFITTMIVSSQGYITVGFRNKGIAYTTDGAKTWTTIENIGQELTKLGFKDNGCNSTVVDIQIVDRQPSKDLLLATSNCLVKGIMSNGVIQLSGPLVLPTPAATTSIATFAVNPKTSFELYYATASTLVTSRDGGRGWKTKSLPAKRPVRSILVDPVNGQIVYLGFGI
ncbi:MAG: hypothetical protein V1707_01780 [bacterium]